jgi:hypothetical protein
MKLDINITPVEYTQIPQIFVFISYSNNNMVDAQNFEAGTTLAFKSLNNLWEEA